MDELRESILQRLRTNSPGNEPNSVRSRSTVDPERAPAPSSHYKPKKHPNWQQQRQKLIGGQRNAEAEQAPAPNFKDARGATGNAAGKQRKTWERGCNRAAGEAQRVW